jgi:hypothetical protein
MQRQMMADIEVANARPATPQNLINSKSNTIFRVILTMLMYIVILVSP